MLRNLATGMPESSCVDNIEVSLLSPFFVRLAKRHLSSKSSGKIPVPELPSRALWAFFAVQLSRRISSLVAFNVPVDSANEDRRAKVAECAAHDA